MINKDLIHSLDFEAISIALEIEINSEIPDKKLKQIIKQRLQDMSQEDLFLVPNFIWQTLQTHFAQEPPIKVFRGPKNTVRIVGRTFTDYKRSPKFSAWFDNNDLDVSENVTGMTISGDVIAPWTDTQLFGIMNTILEL